jgi:hypothetical protein
VADKIARAEEQIANGRVKQAILTLWDEAEEARLQDDVDRLRAVDAVLETVPERNARDL